jgi:hypothetical protein
MRRVLSGLLVSVMMIGSSTAQPGLTRPQSPPPGVPAPNSYQPPVVLTPEDQDLLERGEISDLEYLGGGAASILWGFGIGHAIQGRWHDTGWMFSLGEPLALGVLFVGLASAISCDSSVSSCSNNRGEALLIAGALGFGGLRIWEVVDAFVVPPGDNQRVRALHMQLGDRAPQYGRLTPFVAPRGDGGGVAGLTLHF